MGLPPVGDARRAFAQAAIANLVLAICFAAFAVCSVIAVALDRREEDLIPPPVQTIVVLCLFLGSIHLRGWRELRRFKRVPRGPLFACMTLSAVELALSGMCALIGIREGSQALLTCICTVFAIASAASLINLIRALAGAASIVDDPVGRGFTPIPVRPLTITPPPE